MSNELSVYDFVKIEVEEMTPIAPGANPFSSDSWSMGSDLTRGWMAMHEGFDNEEDKQPLNGMYLVNTRTGQRIRLKFAKADTQPKIPKYRIGHGGSLAPNHLIEVLGSISAVKELIKRGVRDMDAINAVEEADKGHHHVVTDLNDKVIEIIKTV